jgi:hypothetical protein
MRTGRGSMCCYLDVHVSSILTVDYIELANNVDVAVTALPALLG